MDLKTKPIPWHFHRYLHSPLTLSFTDRHDDMSTHHTAETAWPTTECTKLLLVWLITGQVLCPLSLSLSLPHWARLIQYGATVQLNWRYPKESAHPQFIAHLVGRTREEDGTDGGPEQRQRARGQSERKFLQVVEEQ